MFRRDLSGCFICLQGVDVKWDLPDGDPQDVTTADDRSVKCRMSSMDRLPDYRTALVHEITEQQTHQGAPPHSTHAMQGIQEETLQDENQNLSKITSQNHTISHTKPPQITSKHEERALDKPAEHVVGVEQRESEAAVLSQMACRFVATMLAGAMAEYLKQQHEDNHRLTNRITSAQVTGNNI